MPGLTFNVLRVGKKYRLTNYQERTDFIVEEILENENFRIKDIHTMEILFMKDLIKFGKGIDFEIRDFDR